MPLFIISYFTVPSFPSCSCFIFLFFLFLLLDITHGLLCLRKPLQNWEMGLTDTDIGARKGAADDFTANSFDFFSYCDYFYLETFGFFFVCFLFVSHCKFSFGYYFHPSPPEGPGCAFAG